MHPTLPQDDPNPQARREALAKAAEPYRYDYEAYPPLAIAAEVPADQLPKDGWKLMTAERMVTLAVNSGKVDKVEDRSNPAAHSALFDLLKESTRGMKAVFEELNTLIKIGESRGRPESLQDYSDLFQDIDLPAIAQTYTEDAAFAEQRVAGANPMWIKRAAELPDHFPVTNAHYQAAMGDGDTLDAARDEGRLFLNDYAVLDGADCGTFPDGQKYLCAPLALFAVPPQGAAKRDLMPVAIQLGQTPSAATPILTPRDGDPWALAKSRVQTADGNCHQAIAHLGHTHLPLEAFTLATYRQLSSQHPLHVLLVPHVEGTLSINESANAVLLAPKGGVDMVLAGTIETSRALASNAAKTWDFNATMLPHDLAARGVADVEALPNYAYRDDGLLVWDALKTWVGAYLRTYYAGDAEVAADTELQSWAAEIVSTSGGRINGFGEEGGISTLEYLIDAVTHMIFTASAGHAAVNFPQFTAMTFVPNWPLAGFTPTSGTDFLSMLPPLDVAHMQMSLGYLLGTIHYTQLGHYPHHEVFFKYFSDGRITAPAKALHAQLASVEETITQRNTRRTPYVHLLPSRIPQSINI